MLLLTVFTTTIYAQETKEEKAKRILNIKDKKPAPVVLTRSKTVSERTSERKAKRILNVDDKKDKTFFNKKGKRKHHNRGKHLGQHKHNK